MGTLKTYNDMSIYNTYTRLSEEWKSIKSDQRYGTTQGRTYTIDYGKIQSVYSEYGDGIKSYRLENKTLLFIPERFPCLTGYQVFFYLSDGITTFDPSSYLIQDGDGDVPRPWYSPDYGQYIFKKHLSISSIEMTSINPDGSTVVTPPVNFLYEPVIYSTSDGIIKVVDGYV